MSGLRYTGGGTGGFLPDVPARDLSSEEIQERGLDAAALLASGLYEQSGKSAGGTVLSSGIAIVGDDGPEIVSVPKGSKLIGAADAPKDGD